MKRSIPMLLFIPVVCTPVSALEFRAPLVPQSVERYMPPVQESFAESLFTLVQNVLEQFLPQIQDCTTIICVVIFIAMLVSILASFDVSIKQTGELAGTVALGSLLIGRTGSMILLAKETIHELSSYGKLLLPVMTSALAAQGGITASTGLYIGTALVDTVLGSIMDTILVPLISIYLALSLGTCAFADDSLGQICDMIKTCTGWVLKTLLTIFTAYMSITGVVSGATDAAALKATKMTISTFVPMVGGILSDASESVLISAGIMKNAAGIYGILAILAIFLHPFLEIGIQYLLTKTAGMICGIVGTKSIAGLVNSFSCAMGMLLAITGAMCLFLLISTICFMKGTGL